MTELEPLHPEEAVSWYLDDRSSELNHATLTSHRARLTTFAEWLVDRDVDNLNDLSGRDLSRYKTWRGDGLQKASLKGQLATVRVFLRWAASVDAVPELLYEKVQLPSMSKGEGSRDEMVTREEARAIRDHVSTYRYGSLWHVFVELLLCGIRVGSIHSLDVDDYQVSEESDGMKLCLRHRPDAETTLKNGEEAERDIAVTTTTATVLDDWLANKRPDVEDEHGREPLVATEQGRAAKQTLRNLSYKLSRPCFYQGDCPHDRDPDDCDATVRGGAHAHRCPSSKSPHPWRRGVITRLLQNEDAPDDAVTGRYDVSHDVLDKHYDRRSNEEKMESRRKWAESLEDDLNDS